MSARPISEDDLHAFVDRRLDPARHAEVLAYLDAHPDVAARIDLDAKQRGLLRSALLPIADEPLPTRLNLKHMIESQRQPLSARWWMSAAAVALLLVGGLGGWTLRSSMSGSRQGIASLGMEAAESYAVFAPDRIRPVELRAGDVKSLVSWASGLLGRPVDVPNLATLGFRFMGGRMVSTPHGAAAMFMYDNDRGTRMVMLTRPMRLRDQEAPMEPLSRDGVNGFAWAANGMGYSVVGPQNSQGLDPIANEIRRQVAQQRS